YVLRVSLNNGYRGVDYGYTAAGVRAGEVPPDTLVVTSAATPVHADFDMASLRIHLEVSPDLDGEFVQILLHRLGTPAPDPSRSFLLAIFALETQGGVIAPLVRGIPPGTYKLEVVLTPQSFRCPCAYENEHFWWPGVADAAASPSIELGGAQVGVDSARVDL